MIIDDTHYDVIVIGSGDVLDDPFAALIAGVDDVWEVCLLKFTMEMIQRSAGENIAEWKRRGLA